MNDKHRDGKNRALKKYRENFHSAYKFSEKIYYKKSKEDEKELWSKPS